MSQWSAHQLSTIIYFYIHNIRSWHAAFVSSVSQGLEQFCARVGTECAKKSSSKAEFLKLLDDAVINFAVGGLRYKVAVVRRVCSNLLLRSIANVE